MVAVEGPAGIGKTRLVAEARRRAADAGLTVLAARGNELEREFPFGVVRQLFEPAAVHDWGEVLRGRLLRPGRSCVRRRRPKAVRPRATLRSRRCTGSTG